MASDLALKRLATSSAELFSFCDVVSVDEFSQDLGELVERRKPELNRAASDIDLKRLATSSAQPLFFRPVVSDLVLKRTATFSAELLSFCRIVSVDELVSDLVLKRLATPAKEYLFSFCHFVSVDGFPQKSEPEIRLDMKTLAKALLKFVESREHLVDQSRARPPV